MSLYATLDVPADASLEQIEAGYRRVGDALAAGRPGALDRWSRRRWRRWRLDRAYRVLRDPAARQAYDAAQPMVEMLQRFPPGLL